MPSHNCDLSQEEREFVQGIRELLAKGNPNPTRVGCSLFARDLRNLAWRRPLQHSLKDVLDHACRCSECFLDHQFHKARYKKYRSIQQVLFSIAAVILVAVGLVLWVRTREDLDRQGNINQEIVMNLRSARSGSPHITAGSGVLTIPSKRIALTIVLPAGNEEGQYEVQLSKERTTPLVTAGGKAIMDLDQLVLKVKMDCSLIPAGKYSLGIREQGWDWTEFPAEVQ